MLMVRAERDPAALLPAIRQAISDQEPGVAFVSTQTMEDMLGRSIAEERYRAQLSGVFGGLALVLSAVGLYAVVARAVQARTRELGVRLALGATPADVSGLVLRHAIGLAGLGALVGVPVAMFASRAIAAFLYDVSPQSPLVLGAAISAVLVATLAASLWPAIRAARIDPLRALRD
jgi:ABC-type antimicrobial peptide transport system permease subunit